MFNLRGVVNFFVFDPLDPKTTNAHATGLWRGTDGGEQWNLVYPSPSAVKGVKMNSDHADEQILADPDTLSEIAALAVDPSNSKILYAAAGAKGSPALFVSRDFGKSWQKQVGLPDIPRRLWVDPNSEADGRSRLSMPLRSRASSFRTMEERTGARATCRVRERKCVPSRLACIIRRRLTSPTIILRLRRSPGWAWPRPP